MSSAAHLAAFPRQPHIRVSQDRANVRLALGELLAEALTSRQRAKTVAAMQGQRIANAEALVASMDVERSLPDPYYEWAAYLLQLDLYIERGQMRGPMQIVEAKGLTMVKQAQQEFRSTHMQCTQCNETNQRGVGACWNCGEKVDKA